MSRNVMSLQSSNEKYIYKKKKKIDGIVPTRDHRALVLVVLKHPIISILFRNPVPKPSQLHLERDQRKQFCSLWGDK